MKWLSLLYVCGVVLGIFLIPGCYVFELPRDTRQIINGGGRQALGDFEDESAFIEAIRPGVTLAYWKDVALEQPFGPVFADSTTVRVARELTSEVRFAATESRIDSFRLRPFTTVLGLVQTMQGLGLTVEIDLATLLQLYGEAFPETETSILKFLEFLRQSGFITDIEFDRLVQALRDAGFTLEETLAALRVWTESNTLLVEVNAAQLVAFTQQYNLNIEILLDALQQLAQALGLSVEALTDLLRGESVTGMPEIHLSKTVTPATSWFRSEVTYRVTYKNAGGIAAKEVRVIDALPSGVMYGGLVSSTRDVSIDEYVETNRVVVVFRVDGEVGAGEEGSVEFTAVLGRLAAENTDTPETPKRSLLNAAGRRY